MIRRLLKVMVVAAAGWSVWWGVSGFAARGAVADWFADRAEQGWQADASAIGVSGFPVHGRTRIEHPALADPQTGVAWRADWLEIDRLLVRPGRYSVRFPATGQLISHFDRTYGLSVVDMVADVELAPVRAGIVSVFRVAGHSWALTDGELPLAAGDAFSLEMMQTDQPETYTVAGTLRGFQPERIDIGSASIAGPLPGQFDTVEMDMTVRFSRPWDLTALSRARPQPRMIKLSLARMSWGHLDLLAAGRLDVDADGVPEGSLTVKAENWREMLNLAVRSGGIPEALAGPVEDVLSLLSRTGGNPNALDVTLTFRNGRVFAGVFPLGDAPRILLR